MIAYLRLFCTKLGIGIGILAGTCNNPFWRMIVIILAENVWKFIWGEEILVALGCAKLVDSPVFECIYFSPYLSVVTNLSMSANLV